MKSDLDYYTEGKKCIKRYILTYKDEGELLTTNETLAILTGFREGLIAAGVDGVSADTAVKAVTSYMDGIADAMKFSEMTQKE